MAVERATETFRHADSSAMGLIQAGMGASGIAIAAGLAIAGDAGEQALILFAAGAALQMPSLGFATLALRRRRDRLVARATAASMHVHIQRLLHGYDPDPDMEDVSLDELRKNQQESKDLTKRLKGDKPWIHMQFLFLSIGLLCMFAGALVIAQNAWP